MKTYEDKKEVLLTMAELYLDTRDNSYINVNDGILNSGDVFSKDFLLLMALTYPNDGSNYYGLGIDIDENTQKDFVDKEFKKIMSLRCDIEKRGKIILEDANAYYNVKYGNTSIDEIDKIAKKLGEEGFHI